MYFVRDKAENAGKADQLQAIMVRFYHTFEKVIRKIRWLIYGDQVNYQLELFLPPEVVRYKIAYDIPKGYSLRTYQYGDKEELIDLMKNSGFTDWDSQRFDQAIKLCLPNGFILIVHNETNKIVATFMARHLSDESHPFGGRLDWLAVAPDHRGIGLGYIVTAVATNRLIKMGYSNIYVTTDDYRLAAIKTFLKAGFVPNLYREGMAERWEKVCSLLDWNYQPYKWEKLKKQELW